ncbi:MAG: electron transfer flavoprotein subunit alpha/FixB family protein [Actinomycetota bacterium]|nr:electron transfer flavoprotein subunit alpha/FixB family protein [Actinomycetota bacterium]
MSGVWVYAEVTESGIDPSALELLSKARALDPKPAAVALGPGSSAAAAALGRHGAATVYCSDDSVYADFVAEPQTHALQQLVAEHEPTLILFATNYDSRDVAGRLSALTGATLVANAVDVPSLDVVQTSIMGGSIRVDVRLEGTLRLVLARPKSFAAVESPGDCVTVAIESSVPDELKRARIIERHEAEAAGPKLQDASVVIAGGRGLQGAENFRLLDELAASIPGAAVGGTRAVVDAGWVPYSYQIGQTGSTVKPEVYLAFGISGATQHVVGMKGAKRIVAINKDEDAPIFSLADLGVVGNALELLPKLIEEIRKG